MEENEEGQGSRKPGLSDINIKWENITFQKMAAMPCAKTSLINGLAALSIVGASRFFATRRITSGINFGMVAFVASSVCSWFYYI
jgi:hypothetical protein